VAKWDFIAPPDWYRCWDCLQATPFKDLPRRSILLVGRAPATSQRIPRGTGQTTSEQGQQQLIVPGITCGSGSLLVVGMSLNTVPPSPVITGFTISWNGLPMAITDFVEDGNVTGSAMSYLLVANGGTGTIQVDTNDFDFEMSLFATEVTLPVGSNPLDGHGADFSSGPGDAPSITIPAGSGKRSVVAALNPASLASPPQFWSPPLQEGQNLGGVITVVEGFAEIGTAATSADGPPRTFTFAATAAAFRVQ
jgi:hypothetical protein